MENIKELREICIKKHKKGVTKPHLLATLFARRVSIYITWLIVKYTKISANQVTIWQLVVSLIGLGFLCFANPWIGLSGALLLHLGYIFDNVDGEVARYRKTQSINGMFLDFVNHEIIIPMTFGCLAFHYYFLSESIYYFSLALFIILCRINPVGKARQTTINYLILYRHSPSYDISEYTKNNENISTTGSESQLKHNRTIDKIRKIRKLAAQFIEYPNDIIIILVLILSELITKDIGIGKIFLVILVIYLIGNFILDLYIHLKNNVAERDFYRYAEAFLEIGNGVK